MPPGSGPAPVCREELGLQESRLTDTAAWRYGRAPVDDGTRLSVNITAKGREVWKTAWKRVLIDFTAQIDLTAFDQENR